MSLRVRLALIYVLLALPALTIFAVAVYVVARNQVYESLDDGLRARGDAIASSLIYESIPVPQINIDASRAAIERQAVFGDPFSIYAPDGRLLFTSGQTSPTGPGTFPLSGTFSTTKLGDEEFRSFGSPMLRSGRTIGYIETFSSLDQAGETLSTLRRSLVIGGLLVAALIAFPAYLLSGRALKPVRDAAGLARDIEATGDFSRRLPRVSGSGDLADLTRTLNALIERVDQMMAAQRDFLAESSHELRRPLTIIRTDIDVMNDPRLSQEEREVLEAEMRAEAQAMSRLINDLLLLAREQRTEMRKELFDLSSLCQQVTESTRMRFGNRHVFNVQVEAGVTFVGDRDQIQRVLENLLENACIYSPEVGRIGLSLVRENNCISLSVCDTGVGIADHDQARIFDRFYRAKGSQAIKPDGFGLGLAIVKHVVEAHGGTVSLHSQPGQGSTFVLELPAAVRSPAPLS